MSDERGDYRSIYCAFWDDADLHALGHLEYRVLTTLKGTLNAAGIGVVYLNQLAERCHATPDQVRGAMDNLAKPMRGKKRGWIVREGNIAWIVNGLKYEPTLYSKNPKHRTFLAKRLLAPLGNRPIVEAFKRYYSEWFRPLEEPAKDDAGEKAASAESDSEGNAEGTGYPTDRVSDPSPVLAVPVLSPSSSSAREGVLDPNPSPPVADAPMPPAVVLAAAANKAITEKWGEQPNPLKWDAPSTIEAVEAFAKAGVPVDFARDAIYTACLALKQDRPPKSVNYFVEAVMDRWKAKASNAAAASIAPNRLPDARGGGGERQRGGAYATKAERDAAAAREREQEMAKSRQERRYQSELGRAVADWKIAHPAELAELEAEMASTHFPGKDTAPAKMVRAEMLAVRIRQIIEFPPLEKWLELPDPRQQRHLRAVG